MLKMCFAQQLKPPGCSQQSVPPHLLHEAGQHTLASWAISPGLVGWVSVQPCVPVEQSATSSLPCMATGCAALLDAGARRFSLSDGR